MLDTETKRRIDNARDILVGKVPDPKAQVEQITTALIYKFMDDMDKESEELGGKPKFFANSSKKYSWSKLMDAKMGGFDRLNLYSEAIAKMSENPHLPQLFRDIFKDAFLPFRDPETLNLFLKEINGFVYDHSERLGDAYEYLLSVLGSQGDAGQFRTPRHIIDFIVKVVDPKKDETVLDPACGTAGFLISAFKHIQGQNTKVKKGDKLTPDEKKKLMNHFIGYDISPDMVRLSLVNMYLHDFPNPNIHEYDTLTSEDRWEERYDVILANPPFMTPKGGIRPHKRFSVQANRSEVLFVDYIAEHLNNNGRAGVIVPEGVIFQSANAYTALRKMLIESGYLYAVVSLPAGVFNPYSGVKTSILLMDKRIAKMATDILFIKVDNDGFGLGAQRRAINSNDLTQALEVIQKYQQALLEGKIYKPSKADKTLAHLVAKSRLAETGDYNFSGDRYKETVSYSNHKWPMVELKDIANIGAGNSAPQEKRLFENGTHYFFRTSDVGAVHVSDNLMASRDKLNDEGIIGLRLFPKYTILFPKSGASTFLNHRAMIGTGGYVSSHLATIIPNEKEVLPKYLFNLLVAVDAKILTSDQNYPSLKTSEIGKIQIPLPPLEVQREIVMEIDGYQKIIDGAKQVVSNYKPSFKIGSSWPIGKLADVCSLISGQHIDTQDYNTDQRGISYLTGPADFGVINPTVSKWTENPKVVARKGDILVTVKGSGLGKVNLLNIPEAAISRQLMAVRVSNASPAFIHVVLSGKFDHFQALGDGAAIPGITRNDVLDLQIPLPPLETQQRIVAEIESEQALVAANKKLIEIFERKIKSRIAEVWVL